MPWASNRRLAPAGIAWEKEVFGRFENRSQVANGFGVAALFDELLRSGESLDRDPIGPRERRSGRRYPSRLWPRSRPWALAQRFGAFELGFDPLARRFSKPSHVHVNATAIAQVAIVGSGLLGSMAISPFRSDFPGGSAHNSGRGDNHYN